MDSGGGDGGGGCEIVQNMTQMMSVKWTKDDTYIYTSRDRAKLSPSRILTLNALVEFIGVRFIHLPGSIWLITVDAKGVEWPV